jgi:hypothetical protein
MGVSVRKICHFITYVLLKMEDVSFEDFFYYVFVFDLCLCCQTK